MKTVIILKNGTEITIETKKLDIKRGLFGRLKRISFEDAMCFVRYLSVKEVACVLAYPEGTEPPNAKEAIGNGQETN